MNQIQTTESNRIKLILSYASMFTLCFSVLYSALLLWGYVNKLMNHTGIEIFPICLSIVVPILFLISYILNLKNYVTLSKLLLISTLLTLNFVAGLWWGFDLPSIIISYLFCIVILALTSNFKENIIYISTLIASIFVGNYTRNILGIMSTWRNSNFGINDIVEFSIMFIFISFLLIKFNQEQNKTLTRALRTEHVLRKERDNLEMTVLEKTREIKQMQMEDISKMYHLIEFGKLSSGLYHDLITPIQTMSLHIEKLSNDSPIKDSTLSKTIFNMQNTHNKLISMLQNIRKQMSLHIEDEKFNLVSEVTEIINLVKNNYFKNGVALHLEYKSTLNQIVVTKRSILNHVLLNLLSNAYEACREDMVINQKTEYEVNIILGKHDEKNYISVVDNGIGIKPERVSRVFDHFYSSKNKDKENCGIGLSSSKYYAEKYLGGKIYLESEANIGTTMTLIF